MAWTDDDSGKAGRIVNDSRAASRHGRSRFRCLLTKSPVAFHAIYLHISGLLILRLFPSQLIIF